MGKTMKRKIPHGVAECPRKETNIHHWCAEYHKRTNEFLQQVHRVVRSNNFSLRMNIEPTRNS